MNLREQLLGIPDQDLEATKKRATPPGWAPGVIWDGKKGEITTDALDGPPTDWGPLLAARGLDPEKYEVVGESIRWCSWDGWKRDFTPDGGKGAAYSAICYSFKAEIRLKSHVGPDAEELLKEVRKAKPRKLKRAMGEATRGVPLCAGQISNPAGGGSESQIQAIGALPEKILDRASDLRKIGYPIGHIVVAGMGDLIENCSGFYSYQTFAVELDRREQTRVARRGITEIFKAVAPRFEKVTGVAVGGNHGECLDKNTEVLVRDKWVQVSEYNGIDPIAVYDPVTREAFFESPSAWSQFDWNGPMLHFRGRHVDHLVTPSHRLLWGDRERTAKDVINHKVHPFRHSAPLRMLRHRNDEYIVIDEWRDSIGRIKSDELKIPIMDAANFFGWYVSEGNCDASERRGRICISQNQELHPEHHSEIVESMKGAGLSPIPRWDQVRASHMGLSTFLKENFGRTSKEKRIPEWFLEFDEEVLQTFLDAYLKGDGHRYSQWGFSVKTASDQLVDDLHILGLRLGLRVQSAERELHPVAGTSYVGSARNVYISTRQTSKLHHPVQEIHYEGRVYCPTVSTGFFICRRNGKVVITGNSRQNGKKLTGTNDNDDVAVFEQVAEILAANPDAYGNIQFKLPGGRLALSLDLHGLIVGFTHGHVARGSGDAVKMMWEWWKGQAHGKHFPGVADADLLVTGHFHHLCVKEQNHRTLIIGPSLTRVSDYFGDSTGYSTVPGTLSFVVTSEGWDELKVLK